MSCFLFKPVLNVLHSADRTLIYRVSCQKNSKTKQEKVHVCILMLNISAVHSRCWPLQLQDNLKMFAK